MPERYRQQDRSNPNSNTGSNIPVKHIARTMVKIMGIVNLTPDSFWASSRTSEGEALPRIAQMLSDGADIIDIGAVSTRPGASPVSEEQEWSRLAPVLERLKEGVNISIDTTSAAVVRRAYGAIGPFTVNDISAGEDDPAMLPTVGELGLPYIAMHKRGNPRTMDSRCEYPQGVIAALKEYFEAFACRARENDIKEWILDPGLGFAKTAEQNWEILENLEALREFGRPILIGAADKRFTGGDTGRAHRIAIDHGADILRVHDVRAAAATIAEKN